MKAKQYPPETSGPSAQKPIPTRVRMPSFEARMMLPALLLLASISLFPFFYIIWMSFNDVTLIGGISFEWVGLKNWARLFTDRQVGASWMLSGLYFIATVGLQMVLGVAFALLLHEITWGKNITISALLMPMFVAPVIVGLVSRFLLDPTYGLYTWVLNTLGFNASNIFGRPGSALAAVILVDVWEWTPLIMLIALSGLATMSPQVLEAASIDGANYVQKLRHMILPMISGVLTVAFLIRAMDAIRYFDIIWITTNGGPADATKIIPIRLYETAFRFFDLGYAAAIGLSMLVFSNIVANLFLRILNRNRTELTQ